MPGYLCCAGQRLAALIAAIDQALMNAARSRSKKCKLCRVPITRVQEVDPPKFLRRSLEESVCRASLIKAWGSGVSRSAMGLDLMLDDPGLLRAAREIGLFQPLKARKPVAAEQLHQLLARRPDLTEAHAIPRAPPGRDR